ncbi:MAG: putative transport system ATP-binding protein [Actinomycetota bacterium]|jgi:ABC-type lipoprotein export system ATPase subunit|nr:putative transport system ATP-binding protein [Actinomycetota bacterium]
MTDVDENTALVRCTDLARTYGSGRTAVVALHGATCEIFPGEQIALMGPSGSGKSTLLHLIAGLDSPTAGRIEWPALGDRISLRPGPVALVLQGPSLLASLDAVENVALPLVLEGIDDSDARERAIAALERLELADLHAKLPEELSGGQMQRIAIARALAQRPRLYLADEPTGQLDHETATHVIDVLLETARENGAALVVSTHDAAVGERLDHCWPVVDGRLDATRTPSKTPKAASCSA